MAECEVKTLAGAQEDLSCLFDLPECSPFELGQLRDVCFIDDRLQEALQIGGAEIRVFKLLGIHEQGQLVDLTGDGEAISGGNASTSFLPDGVFNLCSNEWRSEQTGDGVIRLAWIGYDFGEIEIDELNKRYGIETFVKQHITTIIIEQGDNSNNRITKARIERSEDGKKWYGVDVITLPDLSGPQTIMFKTSSPSRWWRIRPLAFNGGTNDFWVVKNLQLIDFKETTLENLEDDFIFQEARNRDYASQSITLKGSYDLIDIQTDFTQFGIDLPSQQLFLQISFSAAVQALGRPIVIGDILELPSETQFTASLQPVKKYLEVTDVGWSTEGYSPGWQPLLMRVIAQPALASQETQDIFGDFVPEVDETGFLDINTDAYTDLTDVDAKIRNQANTIVPERGEDSTNVAEIPENVVGAAAQQGVDLGKISLNSQALYVEDGLPPNGADYTEGDELPSNPKDGDYHRLTYSGLASDIPPRLFRWSVSKGRWIFLEVDRRKQFNPTKPILQSFLGSPNKTDPDKIA